MKVAVPSNGDRGLNETVGEHFGRVPTYTIVDPETGDVQVVPNTSGHMAGGSGYPPDLLAPLGVKVLVCRGLGRRAVGMFERMGIDVFIGASGTVKDAIDMWKNNRLQPATENNSCAQHAFRGQGPSGGHDIDPDHHQGKGHGHCN